ncbi:MAG: hypothetical protein ABIW19_04805 [Vicinamibacterales bacterium]
MNWNNTKTRRNHCAAVAIGLAAVLLMTSGAVGRAQSSNANRKDTIIGTWFIEVTLRNCATDAPLGSFNSLTTFHEGGTLSESTGSPTFAIGQRGLGHGNWRAEGHGTYNGRIVSLINFYSPPKNLPGTPGFNPTLPIVPEFFAGWGTVTFTSKLTDADHGTAVSTTAFYKADGTLYMTGCSTTASQRFE